MSSTEERNMVVVSEFLAACERFDFDAAWELVTDDFHYRNHPFPRTKIAASSKKQLSILVGFLDQFKIETHHMAADGDVVLTDRNDVFISWFCYLSLPVKGTFKLRDGKLCAWDDHFDFLTLTILGIKSPFIVLFNLFKKKTMKSN
ncbi:MAG: limonene-1,2-epoxide hydrolase family protein [Pseudomonadota bacterium]